VTGALTVGRHRLIGIQDGWFFMPPDFLGDERAHRELADPDGTVRLPIGAFLMPGDEPLLIDAGLGPGFPRPDVMTGGRLPEELVAAGVRPDEVAHLALSHLHPDHVGWLATKRGGITFPNAQVYVAQGDLDHFLGEEHPGLTPWTREALRDLAERGRVTVLDGERQIVPGLTALPAPGHTPGHTVYAIHDGPERALMLGDSIYCPQQLTETDWGATSEVDPVLARQTREWLWREIEDSGSAAVGQHFPGLQAGRVLGREWQARPGA
jgi:glyoxylase-like metal-dependent hydrolase (beta-lactamase superfamily II)